MKKPLVTVIVLCYNHDKFVEKAMQSVLDQDYSNIEMIVLDDASTDQSVQKIENFCGGHPDILFLENKENRGNCKSFNTAFYTSKGEYIIDLAADDLLEPSRVRKGVEMLDAHGESFGIHYSDAWLVDENSNLIGEHSKSTKLIKSNPFPAGDIFSKLLERYFICPPALMVRRAVLESLDGYDENLTYEDFDFLIRSSRDYLFCVTEEPLVIKRILGNSKSSMQSSTSGYYRSTLHVCQKALKMLNSKKEERALITRVLFESRQALRRRQYEVVEEFLIILTSLNVAWWKLLLYRAVLKFH